VDFVAAFVGPVEADLAGAAAVLGGDDADPGPGERLEALGDLFGGLAEGDAFAAVEVGADQDGFAGEFLGDDAVLVGVDLQGGVGGQGVGHLHFEGLVDAAERFPAGEATAVVLEDAAGDGGEGADVLAVGPDGAGGVARRQRQRGEDRYAELVAEVEQLGQAVVGPAGDEDEVVRGALGEVAGRVVGAVRRGDEAEVGPLLAAVDGPFHGCASEDAVAERLVGAVHVHAPDAVVRVCFLEVAFGGFVAAEAVFDAALVERVHGAVAGLDAAAAVDGAELQAVPDPDDGVAADVVD